MQSGVTRNGDVQIAYEDLGAPGGRPLLLISGLDSQMIGWPDGFCAALAGAGLHVVRNWSARSTGTRPEGGAMTTGLDLTPFRNPRN